MQGDIKVANVEQEGGDGSSTDWSPTLHVYSRNAYGLIGGWTGWSHEQGGDLFGIGLEGQAYMTGATIYGSAGYGHATTEGAADQDLWTAYLEGRYFLTENLDLNIHGGLTRGGVPGDRLTIRSIGAGGEYQPGNLPFSIRASYTHDDASGSTAESDTLRLGLRWNFDGGTLAQARPPRPVAQQHHRPVPAELGPSADRVVRIHFRPWWRRPHPPPEPTFEPTT